MMIWTFLLSIDKSELIKNILRKLSIEENENNNVC